jgi:hypothetical protein
MARKKDKPAEGTARPSRATKAVLAQRVVDVLRLRVQGAAFWDVCEWVREREQEKGSPWHLPEGDKPLSNGTLWRLIARADRMAAENYRASAKRLLRRHLVRREHLYSVAVLQGDVRAALAVLADAAALEGLYPPKKIAPTNPAGDQPYASLSDEERIAALAALYARCPGMGAAGRGAAAGGQADEGGQVLGLPNRGDDGRRPDAGPLAGGPVDEPLPQGLAPLFATVREEPG